MICSSCGLDPCVLATPEPCPGCGLVDDCRCAAAVSCPECGLGIGCRCDDDMGDDGRDDDDDDRVHGGEGDLVDHNECEDCP